MSIADVLCGSRRWHVETGDALEVLRTMPAGCVQTCATSPPYYALRDYGIAGQIGLESTPEEYVAKMVSVFAEVRRVLRDDGTLWLNMGDSYASGEVGRHDARSPRAKEFGCVQMDGARQSHRPNTGLKPKDLLGMPWRVAFALQQDGWYLRSDIIWHKPSPMPESVRDRPTKAHEYLFLLAKRPRYFYDGEAIREAGESPEISPQQYALKLETTSEAWYQRVDGRHANDGFKSGNHRGGWVPPGGRNKRSVWVVTSEPYPEAHFATFPEALVEPCILAGTSAHGCCPTCGAPWRRMMERKFYGDCRAGLRDQDGVTGKHLWRGLKDAPGGYESPITTGWQPSCHCPAALPVPCVVLDPFAGSGTTLAVALRHGRRALGVELNPAYVALAAKRIGAQVEKTTLLDWAETAPVQRDLFTAEDAS